MDITTVLMLAAATLVGAAGLWLTAMAMEGSAPATVRVEAERDDRAG
ncbi:MAG TPA: hypothetical protein VG407_17335 [Caulobacteraceae bacterium]|jgi:hypothetical protein|nr:hypothetical protein [Caulobacteraceae bacterium]